MNPFPSTRNLILISVAIAFAGCSKSKPEAASAPTSAGATAAPLGPPPDGPTEGDLRKLAESAFGGSVTLGVATTGDKVTVSPQFHGLRKDSCKPGSETNPDLFVCEVKMSVSDRKGDAPYDRSTSMTVRWDPSKRAWAKL